MPRGPFHWLTTADRRGAPVAHERGLRLLRGLARRLSPAGTPASHPRAARRSAGRRRLGDGAAPARDASGRRPLARRSAMDDTVSGRRAMFRALGERIELVTSAWRPATVLRRRLGSRLVGAGLRPDRALHDTSSEPRRLHAVLDGDGLRLERREPGRRRGDAAGLDGGRRAGAFAGAAHLACRRNRLRAARRSGRTPRPAHTRSWRLAEFETDAAMLFCRTGRRRPADPRGDGRRRADAVRRRNAGLGDAAGAAPDLHLDLFGEEARLSGSSWGARVQVGSQAVPVAVERRSCARGRAAGRSH